MMSLFIVLSKADSNHHKQNQNLLCYHYTIGQCGVSGCKGIAFFLFSKFFRSFFFLLSLFTAPKTKFIA